MPLVYSAVAQGAIIVAECAPGPAGNFRSAVLECLPHLQPGQERMTITCDKHTLNFLRQDAHTFVAVADEAFGREIPFAFLARVSEDFVSSRAASTTKGKTAAAPLSLDRTFGPRLKQHMASNPDEFSRVASCQSKVDGVRGIMVENIEKVLARGEKIELLVDKCEDLAHQAQTFQKQGRQLRNRMWWQSTKAKLIVVFAVLLLAVVIFLLACFSGGRQCT